MSVLALDAERLAQLRVFTEPELRHIMADVIDAVAAQFHRLDDALASRDYATAADAAHRGRNEALLVGARELCDAFTSLEQTARAGDGDGAEYAVRAARKLWPATRQAITRIIGSDRQARREFAR